MRSVIRTPVQCQICTLWHLEKGEHWIIILFTHVRTSTVTDSLWCMIGCFTYKTRSSIVPPCLHNFWAMTSSHNTNFDLLYLFPKSIMKTLQQFCSLNSAPSVAFACKPPSSSPSFRFWGNFFARLQVCKYSAIPIKPLQCTELSRRIVQGS